MRLRAACGTDIGFSRKNNEDASRVDEAIGLLIVADGMGGHAAGEVASRLAVDVVHGQVAKGLLSGKVPALDGSPLHLSLHARLLWAAVRTANEVIFNAARGNPERVGMGTTIVAALADGGRAAVAHVGDSRLYVRRAGRLEAWTRDHSLVAEQVARGLLTPAAARGVENQNVLTRALGVGEAVDIEIQERRVRPGDRIILCTDGLSRMVEDGAINDAIAPLGAPEEMCHNLIRRALDRGGKDNVTVAAAVVEADRWWEKWASLWSGALARRR